MPFYKGGGIHCFPLKQVRDLIAITGKIFLGIDFVFQAIAAFPHILAMHFKSRSRKAGSLVRLAYAGVIAILVAWNITGRANSLVTSRLVNFISFFLFLGYGADKSKASCERVRGEREPQYQYRGGKLPPTLPSLCALPDRRIYI